MATPRKKASERLSLGRPSSFTQAMADKICAELAQGRSLRSVCAPDEMPSVATIFNWFRTQPDFLEQYARAKEESADALIEEMMDISDDGTNDYMTITKGDKSYEVVNGEAIQRSRLRVDTRKWVASKLKPKKYGDKIDHTTNGKDLPTPILGGLTVKADEPIE